MGPPISPDLNLDEGKSGNDQFGDRETNKISLPGHWVITTIGTIAHVGTGTTPKRGEIEYWENGDIPWVTSSAVNHSIISEGSEFVTSFALSKTSLKIYPTNTLLIALYGEGKTRGKVSILGLDATINQALAAIVLDDKASECREFLKFFLLSNYQKTREHAAGGNQPNLNLGIVKSLEIPLAPINEQTRIVTTIESLQQRSSRARTLLSDIRLKLDNLRQSILQAAFSGQLTADWRAKNPDVEPADVLLARIRTERRQRWETAELEKFEAKGKKPPKNWQDKYKEPEPVDDSELPDLPEEWCWANVDEVSTRVSVGHVGPTSEHYCDGDNGIPFLRSQNVRPRRLSEDGLNFITPEFHLTLTKSMLFEGDILIVRVGANRGDTCRVPAGYSQLNCANIVFARPICLLYTSPSPRDQRGSRMPSSA